MSLIALNIVIPFTVLVIVNFLKYNYHIAILQSFCNFRIKGKARPKLSSLCIFNAACMTIQSPITEAVV